MIPLTPAEIARFRSRIQQGPGCWEWTGELNNQGYGRFTIYRNNRRKRLLTHRLALTLKLGREPNDGTRHSCDNPPCCRPDHLMEGPQAANLLDAQVRGRANYTGLQAYREMRDERIRTRIAAGVKACSDCGATKSFAEFRCTAKSPDGREGRCKGCARNRDRLLRRERARSA